MNLTQESLMPYLQQKSGVLDIDQIADEVMADWPSSPPQRRKRLLAKLNHIPGCFRADDHHYVYLPRFRTGAKVLQPFPQESGWNNETPLILWLPEVFALWQPNYSQGEQVVFELSDGTRHVLHWQSYLMRPVISKAVKDWLHRVAVAGANAIEVRCIDGERNFFTIHPTTWQACEPREANKGIREAAYEILNRHRRSVHPTELAAELLAQGWYHGDCPPLPVIFALFQPPVLIHYQSHNLSLLPKTTPVLSEFLQRRTVEIDSEPSPLGGFWRDSGGLTVPELPHGPAIPTESFTGGYRLIMTLDNYPVSRTVDVCATMTFDKLHRLIQSLFDWENDHSWVFSLVGGPRDDILSVGLETLDGIWAAAQTLSLGQIGLNTGQTFHYVFDFRSWLVVTIRVKALFPGVIISKPVIVEKKGEAPPQYPDFDEDD